MTAEIGLWSHKSDFKIIHLLHLSRYPLKRGEAKIKYCVSVNVCHGRQNSVYNFDMKQCVSLFFSGIFFSLLMVPLLAAPETGAAIKTQKEKLIGQLPAGTLKILDKPYVEGAKPGSNAASLQILDLYVPAGNGPFPLIVWIHGGGWHGGDKESSGASLALQFIPRGFALASLDYRYTYDAPFPAQVEDCNAALVWLRANAKEYHLNPDRVGVVGHSAGAHLAALMAVTGGEHPFSKALNASLRVQAAVCWAAPFDLDRERGNWPTNMFAWNPKDPFSRTFFPGGAYDGDFARKASPASYIHAGIPPMLIVHGARDTTVPLGQASVFAAKLKESGVDVTFRVDPDHGHDVMGASATEEAIQFFERTLR
jgi:acetyl esterase/lipase